MEHLSLVRLQSHLPDCFNALIQQAIFPATYVATKQVTLGVLQCSTLKKVDQSLPQSLQKVEQNCTFCNGCATKEIARRVVVLVCLTLFTTRQVFCTLCGNWQVALCNTSRASSPRAHLMWHGRLRLAGKTNEKVRNTSWQCAVRQTFYKATFSRTSGDTFINGGGKKTRVESDKCSGDLKKQTFIHTTQDT